MDFVNFLGSAWPAGGFWPTLIKIFDVGSYAWTIIIFTIILKLVLSPLDFLQRFYTNKTTRMQAKLQPEMEKIKKRYGQNQTLIYQKQTELYKKNNFSMKGSCIVMLVYMAVTLTTFLTLFNSLQGISSFKIKYQYEELQNVYSQTYEQNYYVDYLEISNYFELSQEEKEEAISTAEGETSLSEEELLEIQEEFVSISQDQVVIKYKKIKDSWLWIKNIWRPDVATTTEILNYNEYVLATNDKSQTAARYNLVMQKLIDGDKGTNGANGYFILSVLVVLVTFLSQWVIRKMTQGGNKGANQPGMAKVLMFILPFVMLFFTLSSSAVFSMYIITNSVMSTLITPIATIISNKIETRNEIKKQNEIKVDYRR